MFYHLTCNFENLQSLELSFPALPPLQLYLRIIMQSFFEGHRGGGGGGLCHYNAYFLSFLYVYSFMYSFKYVFVCSHIVV